MIKLNKSVPLLLGLFSILIYGTVNANPNDTPPSFEEMYTEIGYKSVKEAVKEFENHFKQEVKLPKIKPSIPFTHQFGRFYEDKEYNLNDSLEIKFVNGQSAENHYKITIHPLKNKIPFKDRGKQKIYTLKNGQEAIYIEHQLFNFFVFENGNWQYILGIDKRVTKVTPDTFVEIANSIE